jgi:hypothetical protein
MVYSEVSLALSILNAGGLILLHDYYPEPSRSAQAAA